ncbi:MAG: hypothetical protein LBC77_05980, partial [Spirochaetaceae bacterium]|nr:hypothetical protein [Spirochaetaceae bacterium]
MVFRYFNIQNTRRGAKYRGASRPRKIAAPLGAVLAVKCSQCLRTACAFAAASRIPNPPQS